MIRELARRDRPQRETEEEEEEEVVVVVDFLRAFPRRGFSERENS